MKPSKVIRTALQTYLMDETKYFGGGCCSFLAWLYLPDPPHPFIRNRFEQLFHPIESTNEHHPFWWAEPLKNNKDAKNERITALCLFADILESEGM